MSDVDGKFERWKNEEKYLAGYEVLDDAEKGEVLYAKLPDFISSTKQ